MPPSGRVQTTPTAISRRAQVAHHVGRPPPAPEVKQALARRARRSTPTGRLLLAGLTAERLETLLVSAGPEPDGTRPFAAELADEIARLRRRMDRPLVAAAGAITEVACLVPSAEPIAVTLQLPAADAERHGTAHLADAIERLAAALGGP